MTPYRPSRPVELICFALCVAQLAYLAATFVQGSWIVDPNGQLIATDFVNVWASGREAIDGAAGAVYDAAAHKQAEAAAVGHPFEGEYPWIYPPTFLFVAALLACLPFLWAYVSWIVLTFAAYVLAIRAIIGDRAGLLFACAYPGTLANLVVGQNGFVSAGLIGAALLSLQSRPVLAGSLIGLVSFKPHLGILFPLVLLAGGHWRAIAAATAMTGLLVAASSAVFGVETWQAFLQKRRSGSLQRFSSHSSSCGAHGGSSACKRGRELLCLFRKHLGRFFETGGRLHRHAFSSRNDVHVEV